MLNFIIEQTLGIILLVSVITFIVSTYMRYFEKQLKNSRTYIYLSKLDDSNSNDNINEAVKYLKLTNGISQIK